MTQPDNETRPASVVVAHAVRADIQAGRLKPGDKVPSVRELADRYKVAPMTVQSALKTLRADGLVFVSPGRGTFVSSEPPKPDPSGPPSSDYVTLMDQLDEITSQLQQMSERIGELEAAVFPPPSEQLPPR